MSCTPKCPYFPKVPDTLEFTVDNFGVKHCSHKFICGYNSGTIIDWDIPCPKDKNKEESNGKYRGKQGKVY